jgi:hypothetical protein
MEVGYRKMLVAQENLCREIGSLGIDHPHSGQQKGVQDIDYGHATELYRVTNNTEDLRTIKSPWKSHGLRSILSLSREIHN